MFVEAARQTRRSFCLSTVLVTTTALIGCSPEGEGTMETKTGKDRTKRFDVLKEQAKKKGTAPK
jgi:hypothetical protein